MLPFSHAEIRAMAAEIRASAPEEKDIEYYKDQLVKFRRNIAYLDSVIAKQDKTIIALCNEKYGDK